MTRSISDPDVLALATLSAILHVGYQTEELQWVESPFEWIKMRPSRQVGTIGELLVAGWLAAKDFDVTKSPDSEADRLINGHRVEIKFSTLWKSGSYRFQQLRDQNYAFAICLGVGPFDAHCWVIPKGVLVTKWNQSISLGHEVDGIRPQHGGAKGRDTAWLTVAPSNPPNWLETHGGRLAEALAFLQKNARRP
jgi:hypothetical protein